MPQERAAAELETMLATFRHQPFYRSGTLSDVRMGVYCGWVVQKESFADGMPVSNESRDVSLVFSGEEYPDPGTARRLIERGHSLEGNGASYLVHDYEQDPSFPAGLNGMFHGLVIDRGREMAMLFNDRYGMHPLYFYHAIDAFYFAAEAKAILAVRPELRTPDLQSLGEFVACGCVMQGRTMFKDIHALPGGSAWRFRCASLESKSSYFEPREWEQQEALAPADYYQELCGVLERNLPRYFVGQRPVGMTLTGGLDTRVIMAWQKTPAGTLPCYTFGGMFRDCEDVRVARKVADVCQQPHQVLTVGDEFLSRFADYAERSTYLTEGAVDVSRTSDLYISEKARTVAPVKIVGTYGSEIIRHQVTFKPLTPMSGVYHPDFLPWVAQAQSTYAEVRQAHPVTFTAFRQSPWHHRPILAMEQSLLTVRSPFLDNDFVRIAFRAPKINRGHRAQDEDVRLRLVQDGNSKLAEFRSDNGVCCHPRPLLSPVTKTVLKFTYKAEYAYDYGMPQWVARVDHCLAPLRLERLFLGRHKLLHFRLWYRDALAGYVRQMLLDPRTLSRPYLNRAGVEEVVRGHLRGDRNYTTEIHKLLTLELVQRQFFDSQ